MGRNKRDGAPRPTEAVLGILRILWERGPCTVREVHEVLSRDEPTGYTTALKLLQVMHAKKLVERDDSRRAHVYRPSRSKDFTQRQFVSHLVQRVFDGSPSQLVLQALGDAQPASEEELTAIRELIDRLERERGGA